MEISNLDMLVNEQNANHINVNLLAPQWPFRFLICGSSGSGKSNMLMNLILKYLHYDRIYLYAKSLNQSKYQYLADKIEELCDEKDMNCSSFFFASDNLDEVVPISDLDSTKQNLVIFDDVLLEKNQSIIKEYFVRSRHANCSVIYLSQSYFNTPQIIRLNCNYFAIYDTTGQNLISLTKEHGGSLTPEEFKKLFREAVSTPSSFFLIDKKTKIKKLRYRRNFDEVLVLDK